MKKKVRDKKLRKIANEFGLTMDGVEFALKQYQTIICEITHGRLSKLSYYARDVLTLVNDINTEECEACRAEMEQTHEKLCD